MANSLTSLNQEFWVREAERSLFVENNAIAMGVANMKLVNVAAGEVDTVNKQILSYPASETYTPGTDITNVALTSSQEQLSIGTFVASKVTVDDTEKKQSIVDIGRTAAERMMKDHWNRVDQQILTEVTNALWSIDDGNVGGTSGNNIVVNTDTAPRLFTSADTKLDAIDAPKQNRVAVVGTHVLNQLKLQQAGRDTVWGDGVNVRGLVSKLFGYDIVYSNNLRWTATLNVATQVTEGDTVTIAGVVFTFNATPSGAGSVDIGVSAATSVDNLVAAVNDAGTAGTTYIQLSAENRFLLRDKRRLVATDATTSITFVGAGDIVVSEALTDTTDGWSAQLQDSLFCVRGAIDMVVQMPPQVEVARDPDQFSDIVKSLLGFGKKTYADGAREMVRVKIDASTSDWA